VGDFSKASSSARLFSMKSIKEICTELNLKEWHAKALRAKEHGINPEILESLLDHYLYICLVLQENCEDFESHIEYGTGELVQLD
jgi:hypothetical protein